MVTNHGLADTKKLVKQFDFVVILFEEKAIRFYGFAFSHIEATENRGSNERGFLSSVCSSFRLTGWVLLKLFNSFFWNIQIHRGQIEMVKAATEVRQISLF